MALLLFLFLTQRLNHSCHITSTANYCSKQKSRQEVESKMSTNDSENGGASAVADAAMINRQDPAAASISQTSSSSSAAQMMPVSPRVSKPPYSVAYSAGNPRSLSLSPTHLMRRRGAPSTGTSPSLVVPAPNMPFLAPSRQTPADDAMPVRFSEHQKALEHAVAIERKRAKQKEADEKDLSAEQLRAILKQERHRMAGMARTIADLRFTAVQSQSSAEIFEEGRINCLLGRLETMQTEKGRIVNDFEREEEFIFNTMEKKLEKVQKEKSELERKMELEHAAHVAETKSAGALAPSDAEGLPPILAEGESDEEDDSELDAVLPDLAAVNSEVSS